MDVFNDYWDFVDGLIMGGNTYKTGNMNEVLSSNNTIDATQSSLSNYISSHSESILS